MVCEDGTADLDHGELLRGHGGEVGEVLLDLALGADIAQQLHDGLTGGSQLGIGGPRVETPLQREGGGGRSQGLPGPQGTKSCWGGERMRCGERTEEGLRGGSPHSRAKGQHLVDQHAATSVAGGRGPGHGQESQWGFKNVSSGGEKLDDGGLTARDGRDFLLPSLTGPAKFAALASERLFAGSGVGAGGVRGPSAADHLRKTSTTTAEEIPPVQRKKAIMIV